MLLQTKFSLGDLVYRFGTRTHKEFVDCPLCKGDKQIDLQEKRYTCPECRGTGGTYEYGALENYVLPDQYTIGHVRAVREYGKEENRYMCKETGVGSGTVYNEEDLFDTIDEAEAECLKRNIAYQETYDEQQARD